MPSRNFLMCEPLKLSHLFTLHLPTHLPTQGTAPMTCVAACTRFLAGPAWFRSPLQLMSAAPVVTVVLAAVRGWKFRQLQRDHGFAGESSAGMELLTLSFVCRTILTFCADHDGDPETCFATFAESKSGPSCLQHLPANCKIPLDQAHSSLTVI